METPSRPEIMIYDCYYSACANKTFIILPIGVSPQSVLPETEFKRLRLLNSFPINALAENHFWHNHTPALSTGHEKYIYYIYAGSISRAYQRQRAH